MQDYKKLLVWQKTHTLVLIIYEITKTFPHSEQFGLINQLRRAAYSIPSNIVEGCGRGSNKELNRYLQIAFGSANEIEYQMLLSKDLNYISESIYSEIESNIFEIKKMLNGLMKKVSKPS